MDIGDLIKEARKHTQIDAEKLRSAYDFAQKAHAGQTRMSGEPYITHPLAVAMILAEYSADEESLIAALLHDVVEDTQYNLKDIESFFGKHAAKMVDALTKLPRVNVPHQNNGHQFNNRIESIRKIFEVMQDDVRVIVIKLCDRLHNMYSLDAFRPEKQKRISQETLDIYVRIADRLCIYQLKNALEEISFKYLHPDRFQKLENYRNKYFASFERKKKKFLEKMLKMSVLSKAKNPQIQLTIPYEKMSDEAAELELTRQAVFVLPTEAECYLALRELHQEWKMIRGSFSDYFALPKSNGYQALETSILMDDGNILKCIIQTPQMYEYSQKGVALKCFSKNENEKKLRLPWIESLRRIHKDTRNKSEEYMEALESDILRGAIIVYTTKNLVTVLPPHSTALDAGFYHLGDHAFLITGIEVSGKKVSHTALVQNGDTINFTLHNSEQFTYEWIYEVNTAYARSYISERIRHFPSHKKIAIGKKLLEAELMRLRKGFLEEIPWSKKSHAATMLSLKGWDEVLEALTETKIGVADVLPYLGIQAGVADELTPHQYKLVIYRKYDARPIFQLFDIFQNFSIFFQHLTTKTVTGGFKDSFVITSNQKQIRPFIQKITPFYSKVELEEYSTSRNFCLVLMIISIILFWALNPFLIQYQLASGLSAINISGLKMITAATVLSLVNGYRRFILGEEYESFRFTFLFWIITFFLTADFLLTHFSLMSIPSSHFIAIMETGHIFTFFFLVVFTFGKKRGNSLPFISIALFLALFALSLLFVQTLDIETHTGYLLALGVLIVFFLHTFLNSWYQRVEKVKNRAVLQLTYMLILGGLLHLPFMSFSNLLSVSPIVLLIVILNGVFASGLANFFYLESSRYLKQHQINIGMSFILPLVVLIEFLRVGQQPAIYFFVFLLVFVGVVLTVIAERRAANYEPVDEKALSS